MVHRVFSSTAIRTVLGFVVDERREDADWGHWEEVVESSTFVCENGFVMRGCVKLIWRV